MNSPESTTKAENITSQENKEVHFSVVSKKYTNNEPVEETVVLDYYVCAAFNANKDCYIVQGEKGNTNNLTITIPIDCPDGSYKLHGRETKEDKLSLRFVFSYLPGTINLRTFTDSTTNKKTIRGTFEGTLDESNQNEKIVTVFEAGHFNLPVPDY
jgi:hypothetical protein